MIHSAALTSLSLAAVVCAQQVGTQLAETHPPLTWQKCTAPGSCTNVAGSIVLDANWRWVHSTTGYTNCYTGNQWDATLCPDSKTCATNCAVDGADYSGTYGITTSGNALTLKFKTGSNVGSRVYLLANDDTYEMFKLNNMEFTFDVDVSKLGCGLNGALYFSQMDADGGKANYATNKAGAKYGTGYCDAQCPHDIKFINGEANTKGWTGTSTNSGKGDWGTCCNEMDIWEANSISTAYTPHGCTKDGPWRCDGPGCSVCDQPGCDFNSYRLGEKNFYGPGKTLDTTKKMTVVTQFKTSTGTASGALNEIRRLYVQNGVVIQNTKVNVPGISAYDSITTEFCAAQKTVFGDVNTFANNGGFTPMSTAFNKGVVLVMSIWDDYAANMLWLDSNYPLDKPADAPGVARGTCSITSGVPADVESQQANASVTFSNIKVGPIGSTYSGTPGNTISTKPGTSTTTKPGTSTTAKPGTSTTTKPGTSTTTKPTTKPGTSSAVKPTTTPQQVQYGQCGGNGWTGLTTCVSPYTCKKNNDYYSQCL